MTYNGVDYAYIYNVQGDVIALVDSTGAKVVEYYYDAWGKILSVIGTLATTLGTLNPFRYRGYVFDEETGLYYLRSRYYCPTCCRFINEDSAIGNSGALNDHNLFAYCINNPVNMKDDNGEESVSIRTGVPQLDAICAVAAVIITVLGKQVEAIIQEQRKIDHLGVVGNPVVLSQRVTAEDLPRYLNPSIKPQYWRIGTEMVTSSLLATRPLSFGEARDAVLSGHDVLAINQMAAYMLARSCKPGGDIEGPEISWAARIKPLDFLYHFHLTHGAKGRRSTILDTGSEKSVHIFFLGMPEIEL